MKKKLGKRQNKQTYTFIDLFAGIGGIRIGFERTGRAECTFSSEIDRFCQKTYFENFGETPFGDIQDFTTKPYMPDIPEHDILTGGFPCQPFSSIGRRQGFKHATEGTLFFEIQKILKNRRPSAFLLENVPGLLTHDHGRTFDIITKVLTDPHGLNYHLFDPKVLDAANYGVPQNRKRLYFVGFSKDKTNVNDWDFLWPQGNSKLVGMGQFLEKNPKDRSYSITKHLQDVYMFKKKDGKPMVINKNYNKPIKTLVSSYHHIQRLTGCFVRDGDTGLRLLSENEFKIAMGFGEYQKLYKKDFVFPVSRAQMYRQLGNSVAIPVVYEIAKSIINTLDRVKK
jgi:DNA (cytosine-5)-methyltransferase 1